MDEEIEMYLEANEEATEICLVFKRNKAMAMNELILAIECFLTELTRTETQIADSGGKIH